MQDNLIPLYERVKIVKKIIELLEEKYGPKSEIYI